jgi:hypothetical protein
MGAVGFEPGANKQLMTYHYNTYSHLWRYVWKTIQDANRPVWPHCTEIDRIRIRDFCKATSSVAVSGCSIMWSGRTP